MTLGERIKQEREKRGLNRADMRRLTGASMVYHRDVEHDLYPVNEEILAKIADAFGMTVAELKEGTTSGD